MLLLKCLGGDEKLMHRRRLHAWLTPAPRFLGLEPWFSALPGSRSSMVEKVPLRPSFCHPILVRLRVIEHPLGKPRSTLRCLQHPAAERDLAGSWHDFPSTLGSGQPQKPSRGEAGRSPLAQTRFPCREEAGCFFKHDRCRYSGGKAFEKSAESRARALLLLYAAEQSRGEGC